MAHAQNVVSVCSGVSLPRSVVTDILAPVVDGVVTPTEDSVNGLLAVVGGLPLVPTLNIDAAALLADAAAGDPITLQVIAADGTLVGPTDACDAQADSFSLADPAGVSIGGNTITGLGDPARLATAGEIDSIAIGNDAATAVGATGSVAIGTGATVTAAGINSVALGSGSVAARGPVAGSVGEVSVGAAGAERQITNVAAGTAPTDAANVGQVQAVADGLAALDDRAVQYNTVAGERVTLIGANGTVLDNVADGTVAAGSREAVNGGQLAATQAEVDANTAAITNVAVTVNDLNDRAIVYDDATRATATLGGADGTVLANVANGAVAAGSRDAVNGGQLAATNTQVAANTGAIATNAQQIAQTNSQLATTNTQVAANTAAITNVAVTVNDLNDRAIVYDDATRATATLGGADGTVLANVANGAVAAGSRDAVNGGQLAATNTQVAANTGAIATNAQQIAQTNSQLATTNTQVAANTAAITNVAVTVNDLNDRAIVYDDATRATATLGGADGTVLANVANGAVAAGSRDAVNGGQLFDTNLSIEALRTQIAASGPGPVVYVDDQTGAPSGQVTNTVTITGANGEAVTVTNVAAGTLAAGSTDAVNGGQLAATNTQVAANTGGIATNAQQIAQTNAQVAANGGRITANTQAIAQTNSQLAATNTQVAANTGAIATNAQQIAQTNAQVAANGGRITANTQAIAQTNSQLAATNTQVAANTGAIATNAQQIAQTNAQVAANGGRITANTQAIAQTNSQLAATNTQVAANTTAISDLGATSVRYDGPTRSSVTLNNGGAAVTLRNLAAGVAAGDAVNLGQLNAGLAGTLASAQAYTDQRFGALSFDLANLRDDADAGSAGALAVAGLPQTITPGRGMVAVGAGTFRGESAFAFGGSFASPTGAVVFKAGATLNTRGDLGANGGVGISF